MGTHGLERYDTGDFLRWLTISGFRTEHEFWSSLSGLSRGTTFDHMQAYLTNEGYTGSPHDKLRKFLADQVGNIGSLHDIASAFYQDAFSTGTFNVLDDDGNTVRDDDGNIVTD